MRPTTSVSFLFAALCFLGHAAAGQPSIETFAADIDYGVVALAPDGTRIAYTGRTGGAHALMVLDLEKRTNKAIIAGEEDIFRISWCRFKTSERLLCGLNGVYFIDGQPFPISRLFAIDADGTNYKLLINRSRNAISQFQDRILDWRPRDPRHVSIELSPREMLSAYPEVFALDIHTGAMTLEHKQRQPIAYWFADPQGVIRYGQGCDQFKRCEFVARESATAPWRVLSRSKKYQDHDFSVLGFGPDDKLLITEQQEGRLAVFQFDLTDQNDKELVFAHPQFDVGGVTKWPTDGRITGFWYQGDRLRREFFDAEAAAVQQLVDKSLPDTINEIVGAARNDKLLLVAARSDVLPDRYYLLDLERKSLAAVRALSSELAATPLAPMKAVQIKASDGTTLPGYLTIAPGVERRNLPLVVYPHGGPHARDNWGFDPVVQFLASRGYAVLQVNYRGSVGYGKAWYEAGLRKWGTVMVDDVNAATRWAIDEGIANPRRICIVGWDFGGYAALMGAIRDPELYRCVASIAGVSSLKSLRQELKQFYGGTAAADFELGDDSDELAAGSPTRQAENLRAHVLLVHGKLDWQVDPDHTNNMSRVLNLKRMRHETLLIDDGNHGLTRYEWRKALYEKLESFLRGYAP